MERSCQTIERRFSNKYSTIRHRSYQSLRREIIDFFGASEGFGVDRLPYWRCPSRPKSISASQSDLTLCSQHDFSHTVGRFALTLLANSRKGQYMRTAYALSIFGCLVRRYAESHIIGTIWGSERERCEIALRTFHSIPHRSLSELR